jgi:hypothetical protein
MEKAQCPIAREEPIRVDHASDQRRSADVFWKLKPASFRNIQRWVGL